MGKNRKHHGLGRGLDALIVETRRAGGSGADNIIKQNDIGESDLLPAVGSTDAAAIPEAVATVAETDDSEATGYTDSARTSDEEVRIDAAPHADEPVVGGDDDACPEAAVDNGRMPASRFELDVACGNSGVYTSEKSPDGMSRSVRIVLPRPLLLIAVLPLAALAVGLSAKAVFPSARL